MPIVNAIIRTPWVKWQDDTSPVPVNHPKLADDYTLAKWEGLNDTARIKVWCEDEVLQLILADPEYEVVEFL